MTAPETKSPPPSYFDLTKIEPVKPDENRVPHFKTEGEGYDIYQVTKGSTWGYRYRCTYL